MIGVVFLSLLLISCLSDAKLIGEWVRDNKDDPNASAMTCKFNKNGTQICQMVYEYGGYSIDYTVSYEWTLSGNKLTEKVIDSGVTRVTKNGEFILRTSEDFINVSGIIASTHIKGDTSQADIKISGDSFELYSKSKGRWEKFNKI